MYKYTDKHYIERYKKYCSCYISIKGVILPYKHIARIYLKEMLNNSFDTFVL